jgi:hypothetical protein
MNTPLDLAKIDFRDPIAIRTLIVQLTGVSRLGMILSDDEWKEGSVAVAYTGFDRYVLFRATEIPDFQFVRECRGSKIRRVWTRDFPQQIEEGLASIANVAEEAKVDLSDPVYLYTEQSDFIWRDFAGEHLPRRLRRHFRLKSGPRVIMHSQQEDAQGGSLQHYVFQYGTQCWQQKVLTTVDPSGEGVQEAVEEFAPTDAVPF